MNLADVSNAASKFFRAPAPVTNTLLITGRHAESWKQTRDRLSGGWLVELAAYPHTRDQVEQWCCESFDRAFASVGKDDADAEGWYSVAATLKQVLAYTKNVAGERSARSSKENVDARA